MKQRLVGALVLLSGGVVLWSLLFTGPAAYKVDRTTQIPPRPEIEEMPPVSPRKPEGVPSPEPPAASVSEDELPAKAAQSAPEPQEQSAKASEVESAADTKTASPKPQLTPESDLPMAWVIQTASFSKRENAESLKEDLQNKQYKAYVQKFEGAKGDLYRVMVGPKVNRVDARREQKDIEKAFGLDTLLVQFDR